MKVLVAIPARAGSKGIPHKNKVKINGVPLIHYTVSLAISLEENYKVFITTDDKDIEKMYSTESKVTLHKRKAEHATDSSSIIDALLDLLMEAERIENCRFDIILLLQPTSPIRTINNIKEAVEQLEKSTNHNSVVSVSAMKDVHPARMYWKERNTLEPIMREYEQIRRQDIPDAYYRNGCIYLVKRDALVGQRQIMAKPILGYQMPSTWLLNIDEPRDLIIAEALLPKWEQGEL